MLRSADSGLRRSMSTRHVLRKESQNMFKFEKNKKYTVIAIYAFLVLAAVIVLIFFLLNFSFLWNKVLFILNVLSPFMYGFAIAYLCNPILNFFTRHCGALFEKKKKRPRIKRALSVILTYIVVATIIIVSISLIIPQVVESYKNLQSQITTYVSAAQKWADNFVRTFPLFNGVYQDFADFLDVNEIAASVQAFIYDWSRLLQIFTDYIVAYAGRIVVEMKNVLLGIILSVYFLLSKDKLRAQVKKVLSAFMNWKKLNQLMDFVRFTDKTFGGFITGKILDSFIIGLITFIALALFNMPYYPLISVIVGITNIIPFFGPFIGAIPSAFIIFIADPVKSLWFILIIIVIQQIDGNIIGPKILGDSTGLSALWVIISITISGGLFGIAGMFLGVPVFAVIYSLSKSFIEKRLKDKNKPHETEFYQHADLSLGDESGENEEN